jgi:hypothetical protein
MDDNEDTFTLHVTMSSSIGRVGSAPSVHTDVSHISNHNNPVVWPELLKHFLALCEQYGFRIPDAFAVDYNKGISKIDVTFYTDNVRPNKQTISA